MSGPDWRPSRRDLATAWAIAGGVRVLVAIWLSRSLALSTSSTAIVDGQLLTDLSQPIWPPLYAAVAELLWRVTLHVPALFLGAHIGVHAAIAPLMLWLAAALGLSRRTAWLSAWSAALLPYFVSTAVRQLDVGVVLVVSALTAAIAAEAAVRQSGRWAMAVAVTAMAWFLTRADGVVMLVAIYAWLAWTARTGPRRWIVQSVLLLVTLLTVWSGVNAVRFGVFTPLPSNVGENLLVGNHPGARADLARRDFHPTETRVDGLADRPYDADRQARHAALTYMAAHPVDTVLAVGVKAARYWDWRLDDLTPHVWWEQAAYAVPYLVTLAAAAVGVRRLWRAHPRALGLLAAVIVGYAVPHVIAFGSVRHRMAVEWALLVVAAAGVDALLPHRRANYPLAGHD